MWLRLSGGKYLREDWFKPRDEGPRVYWAAVRCRQLISRSECRRRPRRHSATSVSRLVGRMHSADCSTGRSLQLRAPSTTGDELSAAPGDTWVPLPSSNRLPWQAVSNRLTCPAKGEDCVQYVYWKSCSNYER